MKSKDLKMELIASADNNNITSNDNSSTALNANEGFINNQTTYNRSSSLGLSLSASTTSRCQNTIDWTKVQKLNIADFEGIIETPILSRCKGTVTTAEFSGLMTLKNLHLVLQICNNLHRLILSNISLLKFQSCADFHLFPKLKISRLTELIMQGGSKLSCDELEIFAFLTSRIKFLVLNTLRLIQNENQNQRENKRTHSFQQRRSSSMSRRSIASNVSLKNSGALDQFINAYAGKLKTLEVNRVRVAVKEVKGLQRLSLSKLCGDLSTENFDKILLSQKRLRVLHVYNDRFIPLQTYENVAVTIFACQHTLQDIHINNKYVSLPDFHFAGPAGHCNKTEERTTTRETTIEHNLLVYKNCRYLKRLNIDISKVDFDLNSKNREIMTPIRGGEFSHFEGLPVGLERLILRFDLIEPKYLNGVGKYFSSMTKLKHFTCQGNPESPFTVETPWIENLVRLSNMEIFEFHFCRIDVAAVESLAETVLGLVSKLNVQQNSCIYWKNARSLEA